MKILENFQEIFPENFQNVFMKIKRKFSWKFSVENFQLFSWKFSENALKIFTIFNFQKMYFQFSNIFNHFQLFLRRATKDVKIFWKCFHTVSIMWRIRARRREQISARWRHVCNLCGSKILIFLHQIFTIFFFKIWTKLSAIQFPSQICSFIYSPCSFALLCKTRKSLTKKRKQQQRIFSCKLRAKILRRNLDLKQSDKYGRRLFAFLICRERLKQPTPPWKQRKGNINPVFLKILLLLSFHVRE